MMYSKRYLPGIAVEPEQSLQRHSEAGSTWPSWPRSSYLTLLQALAMQLGALPLLADIYANRFGEDSLVGCRV